MSILGLWPDWFYEPADLIENEDDERAPVEALTVSAAGGWWSASAEIEGED